METDPQTPVRRRRLLGNHHHPHIARSLYNYRGIVCFVFIYTNTVCGYLKNPNQMTRVLEENTPPHMNATTKPPTVRVNSMIGGHLMFDEYESFGNVSIYGTKYW